MSWLIVPDINEYFALSIQAKVSFGSTLHYYIIKGDKSVHYNISDIQMSVYYTS